MSEVITRRSRCPFCRRIFTRPSWSAKHITVCTKWPFDFDRPRLIEDGEELRIEGQAYLHHLPGGWTYVTPERDRIKAMQEFLTMKRPRRPGVVEHPSVDSRPYEASKYEKRKRND